jgi:hypothetical protein
MGKYTRVQHDIVLRKPANSDSKLAEFYLPHKTRPYTAEYEPQSITTSSRKAACVNDARSPNQVQVARRQPAPGCTIN